jgi:hypothetical protein
MADTITTMSDILLSTSRFRVERRTYYHPPSGRIVREMVVHPGAVAIVPVLSDGRVVLICNYRKGQSR